MRLHLYKRVFLPSVCPSVRPFVKIADLFLNEEEVRRKTQGATSREDRLGGSNREGRSGEEEGAWFVSVNLKKMKVEKK